MPNKVKQNGGLFENDEQARQNNLYKSAISFRKQELPNLKGFLKKKSPYLLQGWQVITSHIQT